MIEKHTYPFKNHMILYPVLLVLVLWLVYWFEMRWDLDFSSWGIFPRTTGGLKGIVFSPFIHGDGFHLWHNTLPLLILSTSLFYFYDTVAIRIIIIGTLATGITTWCIGRASFHIGISGVIYMLFGFLLLKGLLTKHFRLLSVSFFVIFVYGGMIWYVAPIDYHISWEGHLSGLLTGFLLAFNFNLAIEKAPKYDWEQMDYDDSNDPFMQCFDENGNFNPPVISILPEEVPITKPCLKKDSDINIRLIYHKIPTKNNKKRKWLL